MKKLLAAGKLGAGRIVVVNGIGGLGGYGVQYARLLGGGATVVGFARNDEKLAVARETAPITPSTPGTRRPKMCKTSWKT
jgi:propanol-preferring alcohol dehydrogenase